MGAQNYLALSGRVKINPHPKIHHSLSGCQATYPPTLGFDVHVELKVCLKFKTKQYCFFSKSGHGKGVSLLHSCYLRCHTMLLSTTWTGFLSFCLTTISLTLWAKKWQFKFAYTVNAERLLQFLNLDAFYYIKYSFYVFFPSDVFIWVKLCFILMSGVHQIWCHNFWLV